MTLAPLLTAPPLIQLHVAAALIALLFGPLALLRRSRDIWHRAAGSVFLAAILTAAVSSFWIRESGGFSLIHILSAITLVGAVQAILPLVQGRPADHGRAMRLLYAQALIVAGIFTLLPGRRMSLTLSPDAPWLGFTVAAVAGVAAVVLVLGRGTISSFLRRTRRLFSRPSVTRMWRNW